MILRQENLSRGILGLATGLFLALSPAVAQEAERDDWPGWLPDALDMPSEVEIRIDREVGSYIRMFSFSTTADGTKLLNEWQAAMEEAGYSVSEPQETLENVFEFTGRGVQNGKVALLPGAEEGTSLVEVDVTLE
ncbi:MAG: hypothetical protein ACLFQL_13335 [Paracoccaceae bacterium]